MVIHDLNQPACDVQVVIQPPRQWANSFRCASALSIGYAFAFLRAVQ